MENNQRPSISDYGLSPESAHNAVAALVQMYTGMLQDGARYRQILQHQLEAQQRVTDEMQKRLEESNKKVAELTEKLAKSLPPHIHRSVVGDD